MRKILLTHFIFIIHLISAQTPNHEWSKLIGNNQNLFVYDNTIDSNGNVYLTGEYSGTVDFDPGTGVDLQTANPTGGRDIFILKLSSTGDFGWVRTYGGTGVDFGQRISTDNLGNIYVGGRFQNSVNFAGYGGFSSNGGYDGFLMKLNSSGAISWVREIASGGDDGFLGVIADSNGNVYTTGYFNNSLSLLTSTDGNHVTLSNATTNGTYDFFVAKFDTNGAILWSNKTGGGYDDISYDVALTSDSKVVVVGNFKGTTVDFNPGVAQSYIYSGSNTTTTGFIQVLNASNGSFEWARSLGSNSNDTVSSVTISNNNIYVTGYFSGSQADFNTTGTGGGDVINKMGLIDGYLAKYSSNGTYLWVKHIRGAFGSGADVRGISLASTSNPEQVYITGNFTNQIYLNPNSGTTTSSFGAKDMFVIGFSDIGNHLWSGTIRSMDNDDAGGLSVDNNNNIFITGYTSSGNVALNPFSNSTVPNNNTTGNDVLITKLAQPNNCIVNIPDVNFKNYLISNLNINTNADSEIQCSEAATFSGWIQCQNSNINNLTGIEAFINATRLYCANNQLSNLNLSSNVSLEVLECNNNLLTTLDLSNNSSLQIITCNDNNIANLDVSNNLQLLTLYCHSNQMLNLNVNGLTNLMDLRCHNNQLSNLNLSTSNGLTQLWCFNNLLSNMVLPNVGSSVQSIFCYNNLLTSIDVSGLLSLNTIECNNNSLTSLDLSNGNNTNLFDVNATNNPNLTCIQVDNGFIPNSNFWFKDASASYSYNCNALSTDDFDYESFNLYPNPAKNFIIIDSINEVKEIKIYDVTGKLIDYFVNKRKIDITGLSKGFYIVTIQLKGNEIITKKIIKE